jgi:hypothetical protein
MLSAIKHQCERPLEAILNGSRAPFIGKNACLSNGYLGRRVCVVWRWHSSKGKQNLRLLFAEEVYWILPPVARDLIEHCRGCAQERIFLPLSKQKTVSSLVPRSYFCPTRFIVLEKKIERIARDSRAVWHRLHLFAQSAQIKLGRVAHSPNFRALCEMVSHWWLFFIRVLIVTLSVLLAFATLFSHLGGFVSIMC